MMILKYKKIFFAIALILVLASGISIAIKGFNLGIDFTGGSVIELSYGSRPAIETIKSQVASVISNSSVQEKGSQGVLIRTEVIDQETKDAIINALTTEEIVPVEERFNTIGPSVGRELRSKALLSILIVSLVIIFFIAFVFRHVTKPVSSWVYGCIAVIVLIHDVIIPAGIFSWFGIQVDTLFVVGLLTILGVSVNDTIVVFDRIRENLKSHSGHVTTQDFTEIVGRSIKQTLVRSLMTSVTVLVVLGALWIWGPDATKTLSIAMFLGMFFGTYSSIFIASPLLVVWNNWKHKKTA